LVRRGRGASHETIVGQYAMQAEHSESQFIYVTTTGRVTGKPREIEIWFVESDGKLYILAEHFLKAQWVQNIDRNPRIQVRMGERECDATARILDREADSTDWQMAQGLAREKYGWGDGLPVEITLDEAAL
jgi:deazaflavin-dependent oxidoreductase (nitroreductase family)